MASEGKRIRILRVTNEMLASILLLPPDAKIVGVSDQIYFDSNELAIRVEHPSFSPVGECMRTPVIRPTYSMSSELRFNGWGE